MSQRRSHVSGLPDVHRPVALPPFQSFLDEHRQEVLRFLVALVGPERAEDCFQETFLAALRAYPRLPPGSSLRGWVLTIARHKAIDEVRSDGRRPVPVPEPVEGAADPPAAADEELWGMVGALPPKQRAAVFLRFGADLTHREVARVLDCSEQAARRSAHEGLKRLKEAWT